MVPKPFCLGCPLSLKGSSEYSYHSKTTDIIFFLIVWSFDQMEGQLAYHPEVEEDQHCHGMIMSKNALGSASVNLLGQLKTEKRGKPACQNS